MIRPGIRGLFRLPIRRRDLAEQELDEELGLHLELRAEQLQRQGLSPEAARAEAMRRLGPDEETRRTLKRAAWRREGRMAAREWIAGVRQDLRYGARQLFRNPGFALAAVLTIGLGIGANAAIFGVVNAIFLQPPAGVRNAAEVVRLYVVRDEGMIQTPTGGAGSYVDYRSIRDGGPGFSETAAFITREMDLDRGERAQRIRGSAVSRTFLPLLGIEAELGRLFLPEEDSVIGSHPVAVISHRFWSRHFGADPAVIGRTLLLNATAVTVIGVAQEGFTGIEADPVDVWVPMAMAAPLGVAGGGSGEDWRQSPMMVAVNMVGRLEPGADAESASSSATAALRGAAEEFPELDKSPVVLPGTLVPAGGPTRSKAADLAIWLLVVTAIVLVIACANVANLLLARAAGRRQEISIRQSIGAGRWRVVRQHLTESLLISCIGGCVAIVVALWSTRLIGRFPLPPSASELNVRPLLLTLGLTVLTGLVFGLAPALHAGHVDPVKGLKSGRGGVSPGGRRFRQALIGVQVALSVVLLVGAGLFVRSLREVYSVDPGVNVDRLLLVSVDLGKAGYDSAGTEAFFASARERALRLPGVEAAALANFPPFARSSYGQGVTVRGPESLVFDDVARMNWVTPGYFAAAGTRLLRGRDISDGDRAGEPAAVINESFARLLAPAGDPVGTCLSLVEEQMESGACTRVVGVVENQRREFLVEEVEPTVYLSRERDPDAHTSEGRGPTLVLRTRGDPSQIAGQVREALQALDPRLPFMAVEPLSEAVREEILPYRLGATLFSLFGVLAVALAGIGLYGVLGYFIAERRPEIGIRRALGAQEGRVVRLVVREGMVPVVVGLGLGTAAAFVGVRLIEALLFGVSAEDPVSFAAAVLFLCGVALLASYVPARRAARVDPMIALRQD